MALEAQAGCIFVVNEAGDLIRIGQSQEGKVLRRLSPVATDLCWVDSNRAVPGLKGQVAVHTGERWEITDGAIVEHEEGCVAYYREGKWVPIGSHALPDLEGDQDLGLIMDRHTSHDDDWQETPTPNSDDGWEDYDIEWEVGDSKARIGHVRLRRVTDA